MAAVIRAEGEAEAARLITQATDEVNGTHKILTVQVGSSIVELRRIEAAKEIAATLATSSKITYLPGKGHEGGGTNLLINVWLSFLLTALVSSKGQVGSNLIFSNLTINMYLTWGFLGRARETELQGEGELWGRVFVELLQSVYISTFVLQRNRVMIRQ